MNTATEGGDVEFRDIMSVFTGVVALFGVIAAAIFGTRLWARDRGKDSETSIRVMVRMESTVEGMVKDLATFRAEVHGLATRLEARDVADHEAAQREMDHLRGEIHGLAERLTRAEGWMGKASSTGAFPKAPPSGDLPPIPRR